VGQAKTRKTVIALPDFSAPDTPKPAASRALETVRSDLVYMDAFQILDSKAHIDPSSGAKPGSFDMAYWKPIQAEFVVKAEMTKTDTGIAVEGYLYNVGTGQAALTKRYLASIGDVKTLGHTIANDIVKAISGLPGIF